MNHTDAKCSKRYQQGVLFKRSYIQGSLLISLGLHGFITVVKADFIRNSFIKMNYPI